VAAPAGEVISDPAPTAMSAAIPIQSSKRSAPRMVSSSKTCQTASWPARRVARVQRRSPAQAKLRDVAEHVVSCRHHAALHPRDEVIERLLAHGAVGAFL